MPLEYRLTIPETANPNEVAQAAALAVSEKVISHLRERNASARPAPGFPKSNYWAEAADSVRTEVSGAEATVTVRKEGAALHYHGGTVRPDTANALAIPLDPSVAGIWPSEVKGLTDGIEMMWPANSSHGFLKDADTGELLYLLVHSTRHRPDPTVLPDDRELLSAIDEAVSFWKEAS